MANPQMANPQTIIYESETAWLAALLDGVPICDMAPGGADRVSTPLSGADIELLRRCWAVCEDLHRHHGWPEWPRDLKPCAVEVCALASFALTQASSQQTWWPTIEPDIIEMLFRRFHQCTKFVYDDEALKSIDVPLSCAERLKFRLRRLELADAANRFLRTYVPVACAQAADGALLLGTRRECLVHMAAAGHVLSFAGAMLLLAYTTAAFDRVKADVRRFHGGMRSLPPGAVRAFPHDVMERTCVNLLDIPGDCYVELHKAMAALADEHRSLVANGPEHFGAFVTSMQERRGGASAGRELGDDLLKLIRDKLMRPGYGERKLLFHDTESSVAA